MYTEAAKRQLKTIQATLKFLFRRPQRKLFSLVAFIFAKYSLKSPFRISICQNRCWLSMISCCSPKFSHYILQSLNVDSVSLIVVKTFCKELSTATDKLVEVLQEEDSKDSRYDQKPKPGTAV